VTSTPPRIPMASFSAIVADVKSKLDSAQTNKQARKILITVADAATRFANTLKDKYLGGTSWLNPLSYVKEFWAPLDAKLVNEWGQVEASLAGLRYRIEITPNDDELIDDIGAMKDAAIECLANVQTIYQFQTDTSGQLDRAVTALADDIANAPTIIGKSIGAAGDALANRVIAPLTKGANDALLSILWSFFKGFWWLFLLAAIALVATVYVVRHGGVAAILFGGTNG
jgi:hypothetical protein